MIRTFQREFDELGIETTDGYVAGTFDGEFTVEDGRIVCIYLDARRFDPTVDLFAHRSEQIRYTHPLYPSIIAALELRYAEEIAATDPDQERHGYRYGRPMGGISAGRTI